MQLRQVAGSFVAAASALSLAGYAATLLYVRQMPLEIWPFLLCTAVVFVSGAVSAHVLKPHYKVDRVLQIPKLKPFLSDTDYKSIWAAFAFTMIAFVAGMLQIAGGTDAARVTLQMFAAVSFGFLYTDAMILLRAKFPSHITATQ